MTQKIRIACIDSEALPLFDRMSPEGTRVGYEPAVAEYAFGKLGLDIEWIAVAWEDMIPAVRDGRADAVWCGQGMTEQRAALVDFTRPYAIFNETVIVRAGDPARTMDDLDGYKIAAIENSTNMKLAETFKGVTLVSFGASDDVFGDMIEATRSGEVDGFVDDDVVMLPLAANDSDFSVAFTCETQNRWGVGVAPGNDALREGLNTVLEAGIADGTIEQIWREWMPLLPFPLKAGR